MSDAGSDDDAVRDLEPPTRFSRSLLWQLQRASYVGQGLLAWRPQGVPYGVTSNPFIARRYAEIIAGLIRDLRASATPPRRPLTIVELGAGSGRFSFYLLRALELAFAREPGPPPIRLVMTDVTRANLDGWAAHPRLRPYVERGLLDIAIFDAAAPAPLVLRASGDVIGPDDDAEPVVAIGNYVFGTIPSDAFHVEGGEVRECRLALTGPGDRDGALRDPVAAIEAAGWRVELAPAVLDYDDPVISDVCAEYAAARDGTVVLMPVAGLTAIAYLARLGGGRLLVITSDKGHREPGLRAEHDDFTVVTHGGCVSVAVNFHALARYVERRGGFALPEEQQHDGFYSGVLGLGLTAAALPACLAAVDEMAGFGPGAYQALFDQLVNETAEPSLELVMGLLRLGDWDPRVVIRFAEPLIEALRQREPSWLDREVAGALERVRALRYAVPGVRDEVALVVGVLLFHLRRPAPALVALEEALDGSVADGMTLVRMALCRLDLGQQERALEHARAAVAVAPDLDDARRLQAWIEAGCP